MLAVRVPFKLATDMYLWHLLADDLGMRVNDAYYGSSLKNLFLYTLVAARVAILLHMIGAGWDALHLLYIGLVDIPVGIYYNPWRYLDSVWKLFAGLGEAFRDSDDLWVVAFKLLLCMGAVFFVD